MFQSDDNKEQKLVVHIPIPWDKFTARGFFASLSLLLLLFFITPYLKIAPPPPIREIHTVPIEILNLGSGDGTGKRSGNLTAEGAMQKGDAPVINIQDAQNSAKDATKAKVSSPMTDDPAHYRAVNQVKAENTNQNSKSGDAQNTVGNKNGSSDGNGLGMRGTGKGAGDGFGDINWGGGGNRTVVSKIMPRMPAGVNNNARIVLQFKVLPDGSVSNVIAKQKADPALEQAAISALKKWRFNRLNDDAAVMVGTIPLTFIFK